MTLLTTIYEYHSHKNSNVMIS